MPQSIPQDLTKILTKADLQIIVAQYDPVAMGKLLPVVPVTQYPPIQPYLTGIGGTLYPEFDPELPANSLSAPNRERCLVALLASRSRRVELAIHIYMALANGVEPAELAHILVAAGVYTGVDTVAISFGVMQTALETLKDLAGKKTADPKTVLEALGAVLPP
jgi:alkylhydroperoxidase/carboxymuconolactone decarboxylase family protein YurZ